MFAMFNSMRVSDYDKFARTTVHSMRTSDCEYDKCVRPTALYCLGCGAKYGSAKCKEADIRHSIGRDDETKDGKISKCEKIFREKNIFHHEKLRSELQDIFNEMGLIDMMRDFLVAKSWISEKAQLKIDHINGTHFPAQLDFVFPIDHYAIGVALIEKYPAYIKDLTPRLQHDRAIALIAVRAFGNLLQYTGPSLQDNKEIVAIAVNNEGRALQWASERLRKDPEIVKIASHNNLLALNHAMPEFDEHPEILQILSTQE